MTKGFPAAPPTVRAKVPVAWGLAAVGFLMLWMGPACRPPQPSLSPEARLESVEGYASVTLSAESGRGKSRLSYFIQIPDRARLDIFDALGRSLVTLLSRDGESYFVLVPKKAYWRGGRDEMLEKFLGFRLTLEELANLLAWRTRAFPPEALVTDQGKKGASIRIGDVSFEVDGFFPGTKIPHVLEFRSERSTGRLKILETRFNTTPRSGVFELGFLKDYAAKSWEELSRLLSDETEVVR